MAITDENNGFYMPVAPAYAGGNGGFGGFGGDFGWLLLGLLFGGWGGFGGGFGGGNMMLGYDFPWLLAGQQNINENTNGGFRDAMINDNITSVRDGISALSTQLCGCCGDMQMAVNGAQNAISQQLYSNEIASLNRSFAEQTANTAGFNAVNSGIADTRYTIATEACATRNTDTQNTQAILTAISGGIQSIKDQLCQDKIDAKNDEIAQLRQEVLFARGKDSQDLQTADIVNQTYNRFASCPVGTTPVYGNTPIFTCNNGCGTNCGCGVA